MTPCIICVAITGRFRPNRTISGVGRIGAIVGPTLGGVLLARELPPGQNFLIFAIPAAVSAVAMLVFALSNERPRDRIGLATA